MVKLPVFIMLVLLAFTIPAAAVTQDFAIGHIDAENRIKIADVGDTHFVTAAENQISFIGVTASDSSGNITVSVETPDYQIWVNSTRLSCVFCIFRHDYNTTLTVYRGGTLLYSNSSIDTLAATTLRVEVSETGVNAQRGLPGLFATVWYDHPILPAPEATIKANTPLTVKLTIVNNDLIARNKMINRMNMLFSVLYHLIVNDSGAFFELGLDDTEGSIATTFYFMSSVMDLISFVLYLCFTSTWAVVAFVEGGIMFYAGWRNNDLKRFLKDYIAWNKGLIILALKTAEKLYEAVIELGRLVRG